MALINPELIALARIKIEDIDARYPICTYDFANGFDVVEVKGALPGAPSILVDDDGIVIFLSEPNQPGSPSSLPSSLPSQGGIKAVFSIVGISTPSDPLPHLLFVDFFGKRPLPVWGLQPRSNPLRQRRPDEGAQVRSFPRTTRACPLCGCLGLPKPDDNLQVMH